jgi:hypothetical protein
MKSFPARERVHWTKVRNDVVPPDDYSDRKLQDVWLGED